MVIDKNVSDLQIDSGTGSITITSSSTITSTGATASRSALDNEGASILTITNNGSISDSNTSGIFNFIGGSIQSIINNSSIYSAGMGIQNSGAIGSIINESSGLISGRISAGIYQYSISGSGVNIGAITNSGIITGIEAGILNFDNIIGTITNNSGGLIQGEGSLGIGNVGVGTISSIANNAGAQILGVFFGVYNEGNIVSITNAGIISAISTDPTSSSIGNRGTIVQIINTGTISGGTYGIGNDGGGGGVRYSSVINTIINDTGGIITGTTAGIGNSATIYTLNNAQGNLTYLGNLPKNYGIILGVNSSTFGRLVVLNAAPWDIASGVGTGKTNFGIYSGSVKSSKYTAVISGVTASLLTSSSLTGTYSSGGKSYAYSLALESGSSTIWDLLFPTYVEYTGPSVANTNQSLVNTASALQGTYTLQNSVLANSFSYDCNVFGANNVCVSAGGRNTQVQAANGLNNTSALLIAAYRPHPNYRIGAYADQNLSVSNPGGTVNLGNNTPLLGLFAAWNERLDGTGTEVKVSAAYGQKNTTITRSVVGSGDGASEAGSGSSKLNSQGAQVTAKYGFGIMDNVIVSPYVGVRYTQNNMGGYTESTSSSVTAPLTYSALNTNATTALAGVGASYRVIPTVTTFASAGVETDTNTANGTYAATNASIGALTPVNFNANPVRTRPTATLGAYYDVAKNQRLGVTGIYRQEAYQAVSTTTVMATYTIGL
ncbi:autotransporter outer membrane beta-barrel domain-containing protein [Polynucleobacter paneuropaeus]|nr:autotransporter outer membrane beta-barrel domain-containing protein [Polynucleobacter paneuropaeus]